MILASAAFLSQRLAGQPLALDPFRALALTALSSGLRTLAGPPAAVPAAPAALRIVDRVAIIPVDGMLTNEKGAGSGGTTTYSAIWALLQAAIASPNAAAIAMMLNSGGGETAGCFDLADAILAARGHKPIWAICDDEALSAAYALASAADRIVVPRTGYTGSVGLVALFPDMSRALELGGVRVSVITFGSRKADGLPVIPLAAKARVGFQAQIDAVGGIFVATVARNRRLRPDVVRAMEGARYLGANGARAGLADGVASPADAFAELVDLAKRRSGGAARAPRTAAALAAPARPAPRPARAVQTVPQAPREHTGRARQAQPPSVLPRRLAPAPAMARREPAASWDAVMQALWRV